MKFDIYWSEEIYESICNKPTTSASRVKTYVSRINLYSHVDKTFDDTLDEEKDQMKGIIVVTDEHPSDLNDGDQAIHQDIIKFWGKGFSAQMYNELEDRRRFWMTQYPEGTTLQPGEEGILRQICLLENSINHDIAIGRSPEKSMNTLNSLYGSMNIKPSQKKENDENYIPFGVEIARFEEEHPIIEPDNDFKDVDELRKNVLSWFLGSLCKTAGIKNEYSAYFEEEIGKYTVERPSYDDEEDGDDDG